MNPAKPFSNNIIFLDTEFSSLDPYEGEILSIGLVKLNGEELYLELEHWGEIDEWVKQNVLPKFTQEKVSRKKAIAKINQFVGKKKPYLVAYVNQFDAVYLYKLFGVGDHPFHWLPIDFASFLFFCGIDPEAICSNDKKFFERIGMEPSHSHHALEDAGNLRNIYLKLVNNG